MNSKTPALSIVAITILITSGLFLIGFTSPPPPPSPISNCELTEACIEEEGCVIGLYTAPAGTFVCQVSVYYQDQIIVRTIGGYEAESNHLIYVDGLGTQTVYLEQICSTCGRIPVAWYYTKPIEKIHFPIIILRKIIE